MKLEKINLPTQNKVLHAYYNNDTFLHKYFDYQLEEKSFKERYAELRERCFKRIEIADVIRSFMSPYGISEAASKHLDELKRDEAVTVVGGQQAGILTGPLYSVHKAISVVLLAKKQREKLEVPVIPLFWVAGEDHDIHEINHVYSEVNGQVQKEQIQERFVLKLMASDTEYNRAEMTRFVKEIFGKFGETSYTNDLLIEVLEAVEQESTFTGFFVRLMNGLFANEGLLFVDAAYEPLRKLESEYFEKLINASEDIARLVAEKEKQFQFDGFGQPINAEENAAHLFYVHETGRMLLNLENEKFVNESMNIHFTKDELLEVAKKQPMLLSNNVVSRPLMQELLLPVLSFVGGAGELAYWAVLKDAFRHLGLKMPIFVPRISITLIPRQIDKALVDTSLTVEKVMDGAASDEKIMLLNNLRDKRFTDAVNTARAKLETEYEKLGELFTEEDKMMNELLCKNVKHHKKQFDYLKHKYEDALHVKNDIALRKFDQIEAVLYPDGQLQERIYHPYVFLNQYGPELINDLLKLPFEADGNHYAVYF